MARIQNPFTPGERVETNPTSDGKFKLATRSPAVITRVKAISPLQGLCIIEHRPSPKVLGPNGKVTLLPGKVGIQLCHTSGRANALQGELMCSVEYHWGMDKESLNIDSRWNCFLAIGYFHGMFDRGMWCLVPKLETLQRYWDATVLDDDKHGFHLGQVMKEDDIDPKDPHPKYHTYSFLAFDPHMEDTPILRRNPKKPGVKKTTVTEIDYPYDDPDIVEIVSHIHPKFVILNAGGKLNSGIVTKTIREQDHVMRFDPEIDKMMDLHAAWTERLNDIQNEDPNFTPVLPEPKPAKNCDDHKSYRGPSASTSNDHGEIGVVTRGTTRKAAQSVTGNPDPEANPSAETTLDITEPSPVTPERRPVPVSSKPTARRILSKRCPIIPEEYDLIHDGSDDEDGLPDIRGAEEEEDEDEGEEEDEGEKDEDEGTGPKVEIKGDYGRGENKLKRRCKSPLTGCVPEAGSPCAKVVKKARVDTHED
ncbi:hypothetical protein BJ165DRAFT_1558378 [Panaeolus papilionaceus]|nr:hypothetical protein BJ165DRAFT_1558378 [Panaeolus papilionaceus]